MIKELKHLGLASLLKKAGDSTYLFKTLVSLYPPFLCSGIKVKKVSRDFRQIIVQMDLKWYNKNYVGTQFGGSLYSMTDPFLMIMIMKNLGKGYIVWDKAAQIEFIKPGTTTVAALFSIDQQTIDIIKNEVKFNEKYLPNFEVPVFDKRGTIVAKVKKTIYIRKK